jgi:hypothetical protein
LVCARLCGESAASLLPDDVYDDIGRGARTVARGYRDAFEASKTASRG